MKIALIGSAPSSIQLAPFGDASWRIWGCSPGAFAVTQMKRPKMGAADAWFEMHRFEPPVIGDPSQQKPWFSPEYVQWLAQLKCPVYTGEVVPQLPTSVRVPREALTHEFGPFFFTSSVAWMLAMAILEPDVKEIGLWGIDMAATEEYSDQRLGCQHFIVEAMRRGIKITLPPESDLGQPRMYYGVGEWTPMAIKLLARRRELEQRVANATQTMTNANNEIIFLRGAIDNLRYIEQTWLTVADSKLLFGAQLNEIQQDIGPPPGLLPPPAETPPLSSTAASVEQHFTSAQ